MDLVRLDISVSREYAQPDQMPAMNQPRKLLWFSPHAVSRHRRDPDLREPGDRAEVPFRQLVYDQRDGNEARRADPVRHEFRRIIEPSFISPAHQAMYLPDLGLRPHASGRIVAAYLISGS